MSRIPKSSASTPSRPQLRSPISSSHLKTPTFGGQRVRTKSSPSKPTPTHTEKAPPVPTQPLSIKEAIALKRAEARKAQTKGQAQDEKSTSLAPGVDRPIRERKDEVDEAIGLGRLSARELVQRARSSGS